MYFARHFCKQDQTSKDNGPKNGRSNRTCLFFNIVNDSFRKKQIAYIILYTFINKKS